MCFYLKTLIFLLLFSKLKPIHDFFPFLKSGWYDVIFKTNVRTMSQKAFLCGVFGGIFLWVLWFPQKSKDLQDRWISNNELPIGVKKCVNVCVYVSPVMD